MRPALSILFFTTLSGAGYGLWFVIGLALAIGEYPEGRGIVLVPLAIGLVLTSIGLLSSVAHLGQPLRAWRALSQWRSSWLSREGVAAFLCIPVVVVIAWRIQSFHDVPKVRLAGFVLACAAMLTVYCTARIYSSLRTIPAWHHWRVLPMYLLLAIQTGGYWFWAVMAWRAGPERGPATIDAAIPWLLALAVTTVACALLKRGYWRHIDRGELPATPESATGLGALGIMRSVELPHTEANYLTREMGFVLARRHSARLRALASHLLFSLPLLLLGGVVLFPPMTPVGATIALASVMLGAFVERWLFFAEARHVVTLFYGARGATTN